MDNFQCILLLKRKKNPTQSIDLFIKNNTFSYSDQKKKKNVIKGIRFKMSYKAYIVQEWNFRNKIKFIIVI